MYIILPYARLIVRGVLVFKTETKKSVRSVKITLFINVQNCGICYLSTFSAVTRYQSLSLLFVSRIKVKRYLYIPRNVFCVNIPSVIDCSIRNDMLI